MLILSSLALVLAASSAATLEDLRASGTPAEVPAIGPTREIPAAAPMSLPGGFTLAYRPSKNNKKWESILRGMRVLDEGVAKLNREFSILPVIAVEALDCGEANAFYRDGKVEFCYELLADSTKRLKAHVDPEEVRGDMALSFYHEIGHALVDTLKLPITGNEEDAVDEFGTLMLLASGDDGAAEVAALNFRLTSREGRPDLRDEHSPDIRRADAIYCLIYGKDPKKFARLVPKRLPKERAKSCSETYERRRQSWDAILSPYLTEKL